MLSTTLYTKNQFTRFKELVISYIGTDAWSQTFNSMQSLVKLILDCKTFGYLFDSDTQLKNIMLQSMELCYKMHVHRVWKMKDYELADVQAYICSHVKI